MEAISKTIVLTVQILILACFNHKYIGDTLTGDDSQKLYARSGATVDVGKEAAGTLWVKARGQACCSVSCDVQLMRNDHLVPNNNNEEPEEPCNECALVVLKVSEV